MCQQHNRLISDREPGQDILQDGFPLSLIWNPGDRCWDRDQATFLSTHSFANRVDGIPSVTQADRPAVKAAQGADPPPDRGRGEFRTGKVDNVTSINGLT